MTTRDRLRSRLAAGPLLADGGMGTLLFARGVPQRSSLDELATTRPDLIGAIHREYIEAGAELIETATFGANRYRLRAFGLDERAHALNRRAAQVAREARDVAGRETLVAGSIGPLGAPTRDLVRLEERTLRSIFREQAEGLLEGGVDLIILETFVDIGQLLLAAAEVRELTRDLPIAAELTFGEELALVDGMTPGRAAALLASSEIDVIGVNCGVGPQACIEALAGMAVGLESVAGPASTIGMPPHRPFLSIMPNAGLPQRIDGQFVYAADSAYFASSVEASLAAGASLIGGCCGTTPAHIAAMRVALDARRGAAPGDPRPDPPSRTRPARGAASQAGAASRAVPARSAAEPTVTARPSPTGLAAALAAGRFVVSVEIDPPRSIRIDRTLDAARLLRDAGVDVVNVSDSAMARVRMGALAVAFGIQHDVDLECIVHLTTRDRNLMALESELLGAHALGVRDILALTGDPPRSGEYPTGTGVWDVDSIGLVEILARLNRGEDQSGSPIGQPAGFTICCALDPTAADQATEWRRLERKLAAGAQVVMTQPIYDASQAEAMLAESRRRFGRAGFPVPVLLGILPLQSSRHAEFLHNEVPGITIPEAVRDRMRAAGDRGAEVGLELAVELLATVGPDVAGTYIMPSFGRYEQAAEIVREVRQSRPR